MPRFTVLGTDVFDEFMRANDLDGPRASDDDDDERIAHAFQSARALPAQYLGDLRALVEQVHTPLAVRSSSLLEDALDHPFAGVYATKMIPNNQPDAGRALPAPARGDQVRLRLDLLPRGAAATSRRSGRGHRRREDGGDHPGGGGATPRRPLLPRRSPAWPAPTTTTPRARRAPRTASSTWPSASGKTDRRRRRCAGPTSPAYPKAPPPFADVGERSTTPRPAFWAVNMGKPPAPDPVAETEYLVRGGPEDAEYDGTLDHLVSTYDAGFGPPACRARDRAARARARLRAAAAASATPAAERRRSSACWPCPNGALGGAVEIEFALDLPDATERGRARAASASCRCGPWRSRDETSTIDRGGARRARVCWWPRRPRAGQRRPRRPPATSSTSNPSLRGRAHPGDRRRARGRSTARCSAEGRPYLLIGFGRWGSSDPWLGIPVDWGQISGRARHRRGHAAGDDVRT